MCRDKERLSKTQHSDKGTMEAAAQMLELHKDRPLLGSLPIQAVKLGGSMQASPSCISSSMSHRCFTWAKPGEQPAGPETRNSTCSAWPLLCSLEQEYPLLISSQSMVNSIMRPLGFSVDLMQTQTLSLLTLCLQTSYCTFLNPISSIINQRRKRYLHGTSMIYVWLTHQ